MDKIRRKGDDTVLYTLMHRDVKVMDVEMDEFANITALGKIYHAEHLPIGTYNKIGVDRKILNKWWMNRSIPASRQGIRDVLDTLDISSAQELIHKCFGLSLSDQYWISPVDAPLDWKSINFFDNDFSEDIGNVLFGKGKSSDSMSLFSPDNTANGNLKKKWKILNGKRVLVKGSSAPYHQEAYNEVIASMIAERLGIPHVTYGLINEHDEVCCYCENFITPETELVSAAYVMMAFKRRNEVSEYDFYIDCCEKLGIKDAREQMEKMLILDYLTVNEDRHLNNFGLIRNAVTLEWIGMAPIYDCGNSLWFNKIDSQINAEDDSNIKCPLWKKNPSGNLELVTDLSLFDISDLDGIENEIYDLLSQSEYLTQDRVDALCDAICTRMDMLDDIAQGIEPSESEDSGMTML